MKIVLTPYQAEFLDAKDRFCAMIAAIGTGKTLEMLLKIWKYCETYPDSQAMVVRKEYTDLKDSTIKDFESYFDVTVGSDKDYKMSNRSIIMFRHGGELNVLKNINLSIAAIEQAEEFETDEVFVFLDDRLRRANAPYRQLIVIANAKGHNWLWRIFINGAHETKVIDEKTGQYVRRSNRVMRVIDEDVNVGYCCVEANMFANIHNLPRDFVASKMAMKETAHGHYMQYVMNSHEEVEADDLLFTHAQVYNSPKVEIPYVNRVIKRVMGIDVARFGKDETVFTVIEQKDLYRWEQIFLERHRKKDTIWISGYAMEMERKWDLDLTVIDDIGVGGGVTDNCKANHGRILPFIANASVGVSKSEKYLDCNDEGFLMIEDLLSKSWLKLLPDVEQAEQLMTIRFTYKRMHGKELVKHILSKEEMRMKYKELKSPDIAKALMMAVWGTDKQPQELENQRINLPRYYNMDNDIHPSSMEREYADRSSQLPTYARME